MTTNNQLAAQCEDFLASVLGLAFHFFKTLEFNRKDPQQLYSICLYARILELASGCKALLENNAFVGIPILLRSMFEADIDLTNSLKCRDYYKRMYASFLEQKLRLTKEAASTRPKRCSTFAGPITSPPMLKSSRSRRSTKPTTDCSSPM